MRVEEQQHGLALFLTWDWWCPCGMAERTYCSLLPLHQLPQISVGKSSVSPFAILLTWEEADPHLLHCAQAFIPCLAPNYPGLLLKKKKKRGKDLVHVNLCEEGCLNPNMKHGELPAGQSYCGTLTSILTLLMHFLLCHRW